jgi:hypothetical protein
MGRQRVGHPPDDVDFVFIYLESYIRAAMAGSEQPIRKLPRGTLKRLTLGQSFAEYDKLLEKENVYVETPALRAALDGGQGKCFFVGRRGTGKTAITLYLERKFPANVVLLLPQLLVPVGRYFNSTEVMQDVHHQPFKSLVCSFKRAMLDEVLRYWIHRGKFSYRSNTPANLNRERNYIEDYDFDISLLAFAEEMLESLNKSQDKEWLRLINRSKEIAQTMDALMGSSSNRTLLLIDRVDESWDGSDKSVILLMAMMHACVELSSTCDCVRPLLFLRENVFERVKSIDKEFARLETFVTSLEWTKEQLLELVERRLNTPLIAKYALRGETWRAFFEDGVAQSSEDLVFNYCQYRPRDVLSYCSFAIEIAQSKLRERVLVEDLLHARRRFSGSRLKDLCDEYADNFPQLQLVLGRFFGLATEFTIRAIDDFVKKLLVDGEIRTRCGSWIYTYTQPDLFVQLLFDIGFAGIKNKSVTHYRSLGSQSGALPGISMDTDLVIHPTYRESLNLQDMLLGSLDASVQLTESGILQDLPQGISTEDYSKRLQEIREELKTMPEGEGCAEAFANLTGEIIRLCLFRALTNLESKVRSVDGRIIRDWIAANHASDGFWEVVRQKYGAVQVIFECKNYQDLEAADFHQVAYYMNDTIGRFGVLVFRGTEIKKHHFEHVKRIASDKAGMVLLLTERDLDILLRQAANGKSSEFHLQELYDRSVREAS